LNGKQNKKPETHACVPTAVVILLSASHVGGYSLPVQIVAPRWRAVTDEIDLIAKRRRLLVFVKIK